MSDSIGCDRLQSIVSVVLGVPADQITDATSQQTCPAWDSLRHFHLVLSIEQAFGIRFSSDVIPDLVTVGQIRVQLAKMGVKIEGRPT